MSKPLQIGITGGIGSGKSIICQIFACLGIAVYDADSRAKTLMTSDGILVSQIQKEFGDLSYHEGGGLNREHLARMVFNDADRLKKLNSLVHPRVAEDYNHWLAEHQSDNYVIKEAALLYETESYKALSKVIVVIAPEAKRIERVIMRDFHRSESQIRAIIGSQMSDEEKSSQADYRIINDESQLVIPQVLALHKQFILN
jgi:dephospho-CoA kinase